MPCTTRTIRGYSYAVVEPYEWMNMINDYLNPYETPINMGMMNIVYYNGNSIAGTWDVQDRGYYDENPWGDWGFDWDLGEDESWNLDW